MKFKRIVLLFAGILVTLAGYAQLDSVGVHLQKIKASPDDSLRVVYADEIPLLLKNTVFGEYPEKPEVRFLGYKLCVNRKVELFCWIIPLFKGQMYYNWFRFKEGNRVYFLKSFSATRGKEPNWLYYDIVGFKHGDKDYFIFLGWNTTRNTNQKIVRVGSFEADGSICFQHPFLRRGNSRSSFLEFEYAVEGSMMLKQDKKGKRIIFDHLAPKEKKYEGYFMFYGPDASYDALVLKEGEWWYEEDVKQ